jgi:hypothetical protein
MDLGKLGSRLSLFMAWQLVCRVDRKRCLLGSFASSCEEGCIHSELAHNCMNMTIICFSLFFFTVSEPVRAVPSSLLFYHSMAYHPPMLLFVCQIFLADCFFLYNLDDVTCSMYLRFSVTDLHAL